MKTFHDWLCFIGACLPFALMALGGMKWKGDGKQRNTRMARNVEEERHIEIHNKGTDDTEVGGTEGNLV